MNAYERLTPKSWHICKLKQLSPRTVLHQLWKLENKISKGTLVEFPRIIHPNEFEWIVQVQLRNGRLDEYFCFSEQAALNKLAQIKKTKSH